MREREWEAKTVLWRQGSGSAEAALFAKEARLLERRQALITNIPHTIQRNLQEPGSCPTPPSLAPPHHPGCHPPETGGSVSVEQVAGRDATSNGLRNMIFPVVEALASLGFPPLLEVDSGVIDFL